MRIAPFQLERYFAQYEFSTPHLLSSSDCEPLTLGELLALGDAESLALWRELSLGYTESQGHPLLRAEIAKLYSQVSPDDVLVVTPEEGIFIAMNVLLDRGDHVIVTYPGYQSLYELARSIGCEVTPWTPDKGDTWRFDLNRLESSLRRHTRLIVVNFPHNPTGANLTSSQFHDLLNMASERGIAVFSDEMYRLLEHDQSARLEPACDVYENAISLSGMSKTFALAGLRIGWLATRNHAFLNGFATFKDYTTICSSAPSEVLAIMALRARDTIVARNLDIIRNNLRELDCFFARYPDVFEWLRPEAGTVAFPALRPPLQIAEFCRGLVEEKQTMLLPGDVYNFPGNHFRVGFGRRSLPQALIRLEEYVQTYQKRQEA